MTFTTLDMATQEQLDKILELLNNRETISLAVQIMHVQLENNEIARLLHDSNIPGSECVAIADYIFEEAIISYSTIRDTLIISPKRNLHTAKHFAHKEFLRDMKIILP